MTTWDDQIVAVTGHAERHGDGITESYGPTVRGGWSGTHPAHHGPGHRGVWPEAQSRLTHSGHSQGLETE